MGATCACVWIIENRLYIGYVGDSRVGALEPMTCGVEGRAVDRQRGWYKTLEPGQKVEYHCTITATADKGDLEQLLKLTR